MRVCHRCGLIEHPAWKHVRYSYWIDSCSFENFLILHSDLAKELKQFGSETEDKYYIYRRTNDGHWVERKAKVDCMHKKWNDGTEHPISPYIQDAPYSNDKYHKTCKFKRSPSQRKLLEVTE